MRGRPGSGTLVSWQIPLAPGRWWSRELFGRMDPRPRRCGAGAGRPDRAAVRADRARGRRAGRGCGPRRARRGGARDAVPARAGPPSAPRGAPPVDGRLGSDRRGHRTGRGRRQPLGPYRPRQTRRIRHDYDQRLRRDRRHRDRDPASRAVRAAGRLRRRSTATVSATAYVDEPDIPVGLTISDTVALPSAGLLVLRSLSVLRSRYAESTSSPRKDSTPARGGQVITSLGSDAPNVVGLVYIAGFGLDEGESIGALLQQGPPTPAVANVDIDSEGFAWIPEDDFLGHFAADIDPVKARVMYAVQQPLHLSTFDDVMGVPAWKSLPSWYLVAQNDEVIPPDAERQFAERMGADTIEVASGHCAMVSHPEETHERIVTAANAAETRAPAAPLDGGPCPIRARRRVPWLQCRSSARTREESGPGGTCLRVLDLPRDREGLTEPLTFLAIELVDVRLDALAVRRVQPGDEFLPLLAERVLTPFLTEVAATPETVGGGVGDVEREAGEVAELAHRGR